MKIRFIPIVLVLLLGIPCGGILYPFQEFRAPYATERIDRPNQSINTGCFKFKQITRSTDLGYYRPQIGFNQVLIVYGRYLHTRYGQQDKASLDIIQARYTIAKRCHPTSEDPLGVGIWT
jgi:hypothetical protein